METVLVVLTSSASVPGVFLMKEGKEKVNPHVEVRGRILPIEIYHQH